VQSSGTTARMSEIDSDLADLELQALLDKIEDPEFDPHYDLEKIETTFQKNQDEGAMLLAKFAKIPKGKAKGILQRCYGW